MTAREMRSVYEKLMMRISRAGMLIQFLQAFLQELPFTVEKRPVIPVLFESTILEILEHVPIAVQPPGRPGDFTQQQRIGGRKPDKVNRTREGQPRSQFAKKITPFVRGKEVRTPVCQVNVTGPMTLSFRG